MSQANRWLGIKIKVGDRVASKDNPRHVGVVLAIFNTTQVCVKFEVTGWKAVFCYNELEKVS